MTISFCSRVGGYFRGDGLVLRNSLISDPSTEGFYVIGSSDVLLERNIFRRNNVKQLTGYYPAAVKIFNQSHRVTVRDNLVIDNPHSNGVWWDVGNRDGVFVDNWVENALVGFFYEISHGATVAGNVFVDCGRGVWALNSRDVRVYHNTFVDSVASFERNGRSAVGDHFGWHPKTGPDVHERDLRRQFRWDELDFLYFGGYATWNYLVTPFIFLRPGFEFELLPQLEGAQGRIERIAAIFPPEIPTHSRRQVFYFDEQGLLTRLDYTAEVVGGWAHAAHLCEDYRDFGGLKAATKRRVWPILFGDRSMPFPNLVALDIDEIRPAGLD